MTNVKPKFTYGDVVRRRSDGRRLVVERIGQDGYHFEGGTYALIADQDCYTLVEKASGYFRVAESIDGAPLRQHTEHGYETISDFRTALRSIVSRFGGRTGEMTGERNGFLHMRFRDLPGGIVELAWLPLYLLKPCPMPDHLKEEEPPDPIEQELDEAFGFD
ncbi:MAG: hypothetical protein IJ551_09765 [Prevotella sp.]|nr:hypothetical protein [Prevotella sp.]